MPRFACVALAVSLLGACHPFEPWSVNPLSIGELERVAAGGTVDLQLWRYDGEEPGLGTSYPVRLEGPFAVAATTAAGLSLRATGPGAGRLEVLRGDDVIVDEPLAAFAADLELTMHRIDHRTTEHPEGHTLLLGTTFDVTGHTVRDGGYLVDDSATLTVTGAERSHGSWGSIAPTEAGIVTVEYRAAGQSRELAVEIVPTIHEIAVVPGRDGAAICFEPRFEGAAVTGVPMQITASVPLTIGPAYCATPTDGVYPVEIGARYRTIGATITVP